MAEDAKHNPDHHLSGRCERPRTLVHRMGEVNAQKILAQFSTGKGCPSLLTVRTAICGPSRVTNRKQPWSDCPERHRAPLLDLFACLNATREPLYTFNN